MVTVFQAFRRFLVPALAVSAGLIVTAVAPIPPAQAAPPDAAQFGMVDVGRVLNESKGRLAASDNLQAMKQNMTAVLRRLDQGSARFIPDTAITELASLYEKAKPTDAEQKRIGQLEEQGDKQKRELTTLQNTPKMDDAQTARMAQLTDTQEKGGASLQKLVGTLEARLSDRAREADLKSLTQVRAAVARVAKAKNLSVVFTGDIAIYAVVDITDEVLKEVNK